MISTEYKFCFKFCSVELRNFLIYRMQSTGALQLFIRYKPYQDICGEYAGYLKQYQNNKIRGFKLSSMFVRFKKKSVILHTTNPLEKVKL